MSPCRRAERDRNLPMPLRSATMFCVISLVTDSSTDSAIRWLKESSHLKYLCRPGARILEYFDRWQLAAALEFDDLQRILELDADATVADPDVQKAKNWTKKAALCWLSRNLVVTREWFDATMNRVSQRFATKMRLVAILLSFLLAFGLHIDSFTIMRDLESNATAVVTVNAKLDAMIEGSQPNDLKKVFEEWKAIFGEAGIRVIPEDLQDHFPYSAFCNSGQTKESNSPASITHLFGLFLTAALMSLGAPFWFNQLKNISNLRSIVAAKAATPRPADSGVLTGITWRDSTQK